MTQTNKCSSWVVQIHVKQIQDGWRRPSWKIENRSYFKRSTDRHEIWLGDTYWPSEPHGQLKFRTFQNPTWQTSAILKNRKTVISRNGSRHQHEIWHVDAYWPCEQVQLAVCCQNFQLYKSKSAIWNWKPLTRNISTTVDYRPAAGKYGKMTILAQSILLYPIHSWYTTLTILRINPQKLFLKTGFSFSSL